MQLSIGNFIENFPWHLSLRFYTLWNFVLNLPIYFRIIYCYSMVPLHCSSKPTRGGSFNPQKDLTNFVKINPPWSIVGIALTSPNLSMPMDGHLMVNSKGKLRAGGLTKHMDCWLGWTWSLYDGEHPLIISSLGWVLEQMSPWLVRRNKMSWGYQFLIWNKSPVLSCLFSVTHPILNAKPQSFWMRGTAKTWQSVATRSKNYISMHVNNRKQWLTRLLFQSWE